MQFNTEGLVLNEMTVGETDRLVTVLTKKEGVLRAFAKQANRTSSGKLAATRLFCYSRLSVYKGRDKYIIDDAKPIEVFFELRKNLEGLTLAQYFCELSISMAPREAPAGDFLRLLLNTLHFLCKGTRPLLLLKSVVELRLLSLTGYMPNLVGCEECGCYEAEEMLFYPRHGMLLCGDCARGVQKDGGGIPLSQGVLTAMRHIVYVDFEKLFSFSLPEDGLKQLAKASERYLLATLGRGFQTLDFFHQMLSEA